MKNWKETTPNRFERSLDSLETLYIATANAGKPKKKKKKEKKHLALSFSVHIEHNIPDIKDALERAWTALRYEHPKLAATVEDSNLVYQVAVDQVDVDAYLGGTFILEREVQSAAELFPVLSVPPARAVLYYKIFC